MQNKNKEKKKNTGLHDGGAAILIHEHLERRIIYIHRIDRQILHVTLHSKQSHMPLTILTTYAPRKAYPENNKKNTGENTRNNKRNTTKTHDNLARRHKWAIRRNKRKRTN